MSLGCRDYKLAVHGEELSVHSLTFGQLREANRQRWQEVFAHTLDWTATDFGTALAGEIGEACNILKKLRRGELSSQETSDAICSLGYELADAVTYIDLLAQKHGIDLGQAVAHKFNMVSMRRSSTV